MTYSLLRLALFVACTVALVFVGMGWMYAILAAALLAALLSYLLLAGPRDRAARWLQARSEARGDRPRLSRRAAEDAAIEDAAVADAAEQDVVGARPAADDDRGPAVPEAGSGS